MNLYLLLFLLAYENTRALSAETSTPSLIPTPTLTVRPRGNIMLTCNISGRYEVAWYILSSEELTLLMLAEKTRTRKSLPFSYNKNENHFILTTDSEITVANLTIVGVEKDDLGLYFCGSKAEWSQMHFARPVRLQFEETHDTLSSQKPPKEGGGNTDATGTAERGLVLGGVAVVGLVFLVATVAAGTVVYRQAWRAGWVAARKLSQEVKD